MLARLIAKDESANIAAKVLVIRFDFATEISLCTFLCLWIVAVFVFDLGVCDKNESDLSTIEFSVPL